MKNNNKNNDAAVEPSLGEDPNLITQDEDCNVLASQLSEKKDQIDNLKMEIKGLVLHLQEKRNEINVKDGIMATLESILVIV